MELKVVKNCKYLILKDLPISNGFLPSTGRRDMSENMAGDGRDNNSKWQNLNRIVPMRIKYFDSDQIRMRIEYFS